MFKVLQSIQAVLTGVFSELPDGVRMLLDFVWKCRWFIVGGYVGWMVYTAAMKILPILMWTWIVKSVLGSVFSFISLL